MELFGPRRMQKVNCLPIEAPLARSYKRWGFCIFFKSSNLECMVPFVGGRSPTYLFFLLPAPHKFEVQSLAMNKGQTLIGGLPSISLAAVTITTGFVQVMHVHQGRLWGQVIPQVGKQWCADVLCHGHCQPNSWCQVWCSQCDGCRATGHVWWVQHTVELERTVWLV